MNDLQTSILSKLQEIADTFGITFSHSTDCQFLYFHKYECGLCDAGFSVLVDWDEKKCNILHLWKTFELRNIESYCTLLCEIIS